MLTRVDLTLDCADPARLAEFWKTAAGYVDEPPPPPFTTRDEWLAQFDDEYDDGMGAAWLHDPTGIALPWRSGSSGAHREPAFDRSPVRIGRFRAGGTTPFGVSPRSVDTIARISSAAPVGRDVQMVG